MQKKKTTYFVQTYEIYMTFSVYNFLFQINSSFPVHNFSVKVTSQEIHNIGKLCDVRLYQDEHKLTLWYQESIPLS